MFSARNDAWTGVLSGDVHGCPGVSLSVTGGAGARIVALGLAAFCLVAVGCRRQEITVYTVPKEKPAPTATAAAATSERSRPQPMLSWALPSDWRQTANGPMSLANFSITGAAGEEAEVSITPLTKLGGREVEVVNMFREQVSLEPLSREEAERQFESVTVAGEPGRLFQIDGTTKSGTNKTPARILTALVHRADGTWFYKLAGDPLLVDHQKPAFLGFMRTLRILESSESAASDTSQAPPKFNWRMPSHWTELPAGRMQVAKFSVPNRNGAKAEVSVSRFPSDTGGTLANVNRWREQLGLAKIQENELSSVISVLDSATPGAQLVDLSHENRQLVGAIVPRAGIYWFYKLVGDASAVAPERAAFIRFAQSTP